MKVALVRYRYSSHGGAERYLDGLLPLLAGAEGKEACLLASSWEGEGASVVPLVRIAVPPKPAPLRLFLFARAVRAWADAHPDHLIFSLERVPGADVYRMGDGCHAEWMERKRILRPSSWPVDYLRPLNLAYLRLEKELFTSSKLLSVIANSERGRSEISLRFGVPRERIAVIRNGVDLVRFPLARRAAASSALRSTLGIGEDETIFLYVGSGFARKGVAALARAAVRLARTGAGFRIVVVGKGDAGPYRKILREGGAEGRVHFTGPVAGAADYLLGADVFVFPTIYEPFSNACLEAMAAGLPVITTAVNGVSEVIREGVSGLVVDDPMDDAGIAERMERLLSIDTRRRMGEEARRAAEGLTMERNAAETLSVLEEAWRKKAGPGGGVR